VHQLPPPLNTWNIYPPWEDQDFRYQRGVLSDDGVWSPLLTPKGYAFFNAKQRIRLAKGCRKSAKTLTCANTIARHMWETNGAVVAVLARTLKNGKEGAWKDLTQFVFPGWEYAGFGFKVLDSGNDPITKMPWVRVSNMHGTTSDVQLHSLDVESDVETKFFSMRFSALWFSQADQFESVDSFRILVMQLRMIGLPREAHLCLLDANPPEAAEDHWLYDVFESAKVEGSKHYNPRYHEEFLSMEMGLDDNPLLPEAEKQELKDLYKSDPIRYARFVEGKWIRDTAEGYFEKTFNYNIVVRGKADSLNPAEWSVLTPPRSTPVLMTGTDLGELNHATGFWFQYTNDKGQLCFGKFDEVCSLNSPVSIATFAKKVWGRVQFWNEWMKNTYGMDKPPVWRHWADSALFDFSASTGVMDAAVFWQATDKNMELRPVEKGKGSVRLRINIANRLFFENRIIMSAHCKWGIGWAQFLRPPKTKAQFSSKTVPIAKGALIYRHPFDADSYLFRAELPFEFSLANDEPATAVGVITT
jgi:hypothetical protein